MNTMTDHTAFDDGKVDKMSDEIAEDMVDDEMIDDDTGMVDEMTTIFDEDDIFDLAVYNVFDELTLGQFGRVTPQHAAGDCDGDDAMPSPVLRGDTPTSDVEAARAAILDDPVNDMVWAMLHETLTEGAASEDLMSDPDTMDDLLWAMMHDALSGRAAYEPANVNDALDEMVTSMLIHAFFGPAAIRSRHPSLYADKSVACDAGGREDAPTSTPEIVSEIDDNDNDSMRKVCDHIPCLAEEGDHEARDSNSHGEAPVVWNAKKGGWKWAKKIWRRVRRKGR